MVKTSIYLDERSRAQLRRLAEREGRTQSEILREALTRYTAKPDRHFSMAGSLPGTYSGDRRSIADIPEEGLLAGFGEDRP